jgi:hypothetical protein
MGRRWRENCNFLPWIVKKGKQAKKNYDKNNLFKIFPKFRRRRPTAVH